MSSKSWLAIDVGTAPMLRAQELRFAWEQFVAGLTHADEQEGDPDDVREPIVESWRRSVAAGIDPVGHQLAPIVADEDETQMLWEEHPLARAAPLIHECLAAVAEDADHLVVITDANGVLLSVEGSPSLRLRAADHMNFTEGTLWSEPGAGTNAIGTAIAADHAVQVFGPEHFNEVVQRWTCSAAPDPRPRHRRAARRDRPDRRLLDRAAPQPRRRDRHRAGGRGLVAPGDAGARPAPARALRQPGRGRARLARAGHPQRQADHRRPRQLGEHGPAGDPARRRAPDAPVRCARRSPSRSDRPRSCSSSAPPSAWSRPDPRPLARLQLLGRERALLEVNGDCTELRPRLGEILAVLCAHPEGRSADALCADLHGDEGRAASVRVEVSRLRKLLGPWIDTERYRLTCDVETDVRRVEGLRAPARSARRPRSTRGRCSPTPRPRPSSRRASSSTPGLRQAVMTANDPAALWAWVNSSSGRDDLGAWKRLLAGLEYRDPRHSLCAARIGELRRSLS